MIASRPPHPSRFVDENIGVISPSPSDSGGSAAMEGAAPDPGAGSTWQPEVVGAVFAAVPAPADVTRAGTAATEGPGARATATSAEAAAAVEADTGDEEAALAASKPAANSEASWYRA